MVFGDDEDVFAQPELGVPLDRTKGTRMFQAACIEAGVRKIRFQEYAPQFATTLASAGVPLSGEACDGRRGSKRRVVPTFHNVGTTRIPRAAPFRRLRKRGP